MTHPPPPATPKPAKRGRFRWRRWLAICVGFLLLSEVLLRLIFGFARPLLYQADAACGYVPKPNQNIVRLFCRNSINAFSMRSPDIALPRPANTFRILCIGDSVTYGTTYLPQDQIFTFRLAQRLPALLRQPVDVCNASAGGWAPANEFAYLQSRGTLDANLVLFIWNTGDITQEFATLTPNLSFPVANPHTAMGEVWSRYVAPRIFHGGPSTADPGSVASSSAASVSQIANNLNLLVRAQALAAHAGASFGLVYVVSPGADFQTPSYDAARQQLLQWTHDHAIPLLDLTAAFHDHGWMTLTKDGIHLSPAGHTLVADEIASHLSSFTTAPTTR
jgi:hypothetical protein